MSFSDNIHIIKDGFDMKILNQSLKREYVFEDSSKVDGLILFFNVNARGSYESLVSDYSTTINYNETIIDIVNTDYGKGTLKAMDNAKRVVMIIGKDILKNFLPCNRQIEILNFFETKENIKRLSVHKTNTKSKIIINDIINENYNKTLENLYLEHVGLQLVYEEMHCLFNSEVYTREVKFSRQDIEAIYYAKELLKQNIHNPLSICELAKKTTINEFKLKIGFRKFLNNSPYSLSLAYRLEKAKELLEKSELNINEIASQVGYKYAQSFSNAFYKMYKIRPKDIMKSRKYYY